MSTNYEEFIERKSQSTDGCGWCSHPSRYDGRCGTCGDERQ